MPRASPNLTNFTSGEWSPRLDGRVLLDKYKNSAKEIENFTIQPHGGVTRRSGTRFVKEVKDSTKQSRLIEFIFSVIQSYIIEMGDITFRFFRDQSNLAAPNTDASIVNGTFDSDITSWTDESSGAASIAHNGTINALNLVGASAEIAIAEQAPTFTTTSILHVLKFQVIGVFSDTVKVRIGSATDLEDFLTETTFGVGFHAIEFTPTTSPMFIQFRNDRAKTVSIDNVSLIDNDAVEISSPYTEAQLRSVHKAQSADVMYMCHNSHEVMKLERRGNATWSLSEVNFFSGPFLDENITATTLSPAATTGLGINVTASTDLFVSTDVNRLLTITHSSTLGVAIITAFTSATVVVVDILTDFAATTAQAAWSLGAFSDTTGHPSTVNFFEQRLVFAGTSDQPQTVFGSKSNDLENFLAGVNDDDPLQFTVFTGQVNTIRWLDPGDALIIGTAGSEIAMAANTLSEALTPSNVTAKRQTSKGSTNIQPIRVDQQVLFIQQSQRKLRQFVFKFEVDTFVAPDLTILAEHISKGDFVEIAYMKNPDSIVWLVRGDGVLCGLTYETDENVIGWHRHIFGGTFGTGDAECESVAVIQGNAGTDNLDFDETWVIVKRTIDGVTKRFIEFIESPFEDGDKQNSAFFVDSGLTLDLPITISGATQADPVVVTTSSNHGVTNGKFFDIEDVVGMTELNDTRFLAANITPTTIELQNPAAVDIDGTGFTAYTSGGELREAETVITGLGHLEGEVVSILSDGAVEPDQTVSSSQITLPNAGSLVHVGKGFRSKLKTQRLEAGQSEGTAQGKIKRIHKVNVRLFNSLGLKFGPNEDTLDIAKFRNAADDMDSAPSLFSGDLQVAWNKGYEKEAHMVFIQDQPLPCNILSIMPQEETSNL